MGWSNLAENDSVGDQKRRPQNMNDRHCQDRVGPIGQGLSVFTLSTSCGHMGNYAAI